MELRESDGGGLAREGSWAAAAVTAAGTCVCARGAPSALPPSCPGEQPGLGRGGERDRSSLPVGAAG